MIYIIYYSEDKIMRLAMQRTYQRRGGPIDPASKACAYAFFTLWPTKNK